MNITQTIKLFIFLSLTPLIINSAYSETHFEKSKMCYEKADYICSFRELVNHLEEKPNAQLLNMTFGSPTKLGELVELQFHLASKKMQPSEIDSTANRMVSIISERSSHPHTNIHLLPYYVSRFEACSKIKNTNCINEAIYFICRSLDNGEFSWSQRPEANQPITGKERADKVKKHCGNNTFLSENRSALITKIDEIANTIKTADDFDDYISLIISEDSIKFLKENGKWKGYRSSVEPSIPDTLEDLEKIRNIKPEINRSGDKLKASFTMKSETSSMTETIIFAKRENDWSMY